MGILSQAAAQHFYQLPVWRTKNLTNKHKFELCVRKTWVGNGFLTLQNTTCRAIKQRQADNAVEPRPTGGTWSRVNNIGASELEPFSITYYHILLDPSGKTLFYQENLTFTWPNPRSFSLFPNSYFSNNF